MEIGIYSFGELTPDATTGHLITPQERLRNLLEEIEIAGPVRRSEIHDARGAIVKTIRSLEESGQIIVRRDAEDELVS